MVEIRNESGFGEERENLSPRHLPFVSDLKADPSRTAKERPSAKVWRKPGAGSVPTRPLADPFDFSSVDSPDEVASDQGEMDPVWLDARRRAFILLDEWLTWDSFVDDESLSEPEGGPPRNANFEFVLKEVIADPSDVLHYSLRTFSTGSWNVSVPGHLGTDKPCMPMRGLRFDPLA
jgi:hypothetical protein